MKKIISIVLTLILVFSSLGVFADTQDVDITLAVNGKVLETDVAPFAKDGRTMVPFRTIFEALGMEVNWIESLHKVYTTSDDITVILTLDSDKMVVNSEIITLDVAPFAKDGRIMVPARAVCEALNCTVNWNPDGNIVSVRTKDYTGEDFTYQGSIGGDPEYIIKDNDYVNSLLAGINAQRATAGLSPLVYDQRLEYVANVHCVDMCDRDYLDHTSPEGVTFSQRLDSAGIYYQTAAENLASGYTTSESVLTAWINSPKHRANIMGAGFTKIGIGYAAGGSNGTYWSLIFISE